MPKQEGRHALRAAARCIVQFHGVVRDAGAVGGLVLGLDLRMRRIGSAAELRVPRLTADWFYVRQGKRNLRFVQGGRYAFCRAVFRSVSRWSTLLR